MASFTTIGVVNASLELIAAQTQITSLTDGSTSANAAAVVYQPTVQILLRDLEPDFARYTAPLSLSAAATPVVPWAFEYLYPADCLRLRQVRPPTGYDINNPQPIRALVSFDIISGVNTKIILTNQTSALGVYTSSTVTEAQWDSSFYDAVVRRLANPLAMALSGRPDFARELLDESMKMGQIAEFVDDFGFRRGAS